MKYGLLGEKLPYSHSPKIHAMLGNGNYTLFEKESDTITLQRAIATIYSMIDADSGSAARALRLIPENTPLATHIKEYIAQI